MASRLPSSDTAEAPRKRCATCNRHLGGRSATQRYCSRACAQRLRYREYQHKLATAGGVARGCQRCGLRFQSYGRHHRYCSDACRDDRRSHHSVYSPMPKVVRDALCETCAQLFRSLGPHHRFCSDSCRRTRTRKRGPSLTTPPIPPRGEDPEEWTILEVAVLLDETPGEVYSHLLDGLFGHRDAGCWEGTIGGVLRDAAPRVLPSGIETYRSWLAERNRQPKLIIPTHFTGDDYDSDREDGMALRGNAPAGRLRGVPQERGEVTRSG